MNTPSASLSQVSGILQALTASRPVILGKNLVGIYLYGSLTQRSLNPERSAIDCLVVTRRVLTLTQFRKLLRGSPAWPM